MGLFRKKFDFQVLSTAMMGAVEGVFKQMCSEKFSRSPGVKTELILVDRNNPEKMSASGFDKHIGRCYISAINFYLSPQHMEKNKMCGTFIVYTRQSCALKLLRSLKMADDANLDETVLMDTLGEFANIIGGAFKAALARVGYADLTMSTPKNYQDVADGGVDFDFKQDEYQEYRFSLWQETAVIVDITLSPIPHKT